MSQKIKGKNIKVNWRNKNNAMKCFHATQCLSAYIFRNELGKIKTGHIRRYHFPHVAERLRQGVQLILRA